VTFCTRTASPAPALAILGGIQQGPATIGRHQVSRAHGRREMLGHYALSLVATVIMLD
jgi:hypothetical protein